MITIYENVPESVNVRAGDSLYVSTSGYVLIEAESGLGIAPGVLASSFFGVRSFGPWPQDGVVRLTASVRSGSYSVGVLSDPAMFAKDANNNVTGLTGNGADGESFLSWQSSPYAKSRTRFDGDFIPDPRRHIATKTATATNSASSDYLGPPEARRIVISLDSNTSTSTITATGGQSVALFAAAAAAGFRWDEPNRPMQYITAGAQASGAVVTITEGA